MWLEWGGGEGGEDAGWRVVWMMPIINPVCLRRGRAVRMTSNRFWISMKVKPTGFADGMRWGVKESGVKDHPRVSGQSKWEAG